MAVQRLCSGPDRIAGEGAWYHLGHAVALLASRVETAANDAEIVGAFDGAQAARDLLFYLGHAHCPFGHIVGERHGKVTNKHQHRIGMFAQAPEQLACNRLLGTTAFPDGKFDLGMQRFASADNGIVECPEGGNVSVAETLSGAPRCPTVDVDERGGA